MSHTIDDFRKFLHPERETNVFNPGRCIENVLNILGAQLKSNNIIHTYNLQDSLSFYGVENEFKQVMIILLNNAMDAIKLQMQEKNIGQGKITITMSCRNGQGLVEVSDNGGGISETIIDDIFNPYFTTKHDSTGTGIGLYLAKNIIESRMKGSLSVKTIDSGSCFMIKVPLVHHADDEC